MALKDYSQLETWQRAIDLAAGFYEVTRTYTQLLLAKRLGYSETGSIDAILGQAATVGKLLNGLIRSVAPPSERA